MIMALLLDLANIVGGLLLAVPLLRQIPSAGDGVSRFTGRIAPWGWASGMRPSEHGPVWRMSAFRNRFLGAFDSRPTSP